MSRTREHPEPETSCLQGARHFCAPMDFAVVKEAALKFLKIIRKNKGNFKKQYLEE